MCGLDYIITDYIMDNKANIWDLDLQYTVLKHLTNM